MTKCHDHTVCTKLTAECLWSHSISALFMKINHKYLEYYYKSEKSHFHDYMKDLVNIVSKNTFLTFSCIRINFLFFHWFLWFRNIDFNPHVWFNPKNNKQLIYNCKKSKNGFFWSGTKVVGSHERVLMNFNDKKYIILVICK